MVRSISLVLSILALAIVAGLHLGTSFAWVPQHRSDQELQPMFRKRAPAQIPDANLCGGIPPGTILDRVSSPYTVTCDVLISASLEVQPGVEIRFQPGTSLSVREGTLLASGTETQPITFTSNQATLQPGDWAGLRFEAGSSDSRLNWCLVEYADVGVHVYAGPGTTVSPTLAHCTVRHSASHGIVVEGEVAGCDAALAQPAILGCTIEHNGACGLYGYGHGSEASGCEPPQSGSAGGKLSASTIRHNQLSGVCLRAKTGYQVEGEVRIEVEGNLITANAVHGIRMYGDEAVHPRITNNLIYDNWGAGIRWEALHGAWNLPIVNNTVIANGEDGMLLYGPAGQVQVTNNILVGNDRYGLSCAGGPYPASSHNDVWSNVDGSYDSCPPGTGDLSADPLFVDAAAGLYHLQLGSPCIDAGTADGAPTLDIDGVPRPQGSGFDIGAYEFWAPELEVSQAGLEIASGSRYEFGRVGAGTSRSAEFSIGNVGNKTLLVESIEVTPQGPFSVSTPSSFPVAVSQASSATFDVQFAPVATGEQTATVSIDSDDSDEDPFTFLVAGQGVQALTDLSLSGPEAGLIDLSYTLTATVSPPEATQPITYTWQASGQSPRTHVGGLSDTVAFVWSTPGPRGVTVTAGNIQNAITRTHLISLYTPCRADFVAMPTAGPVPLLVTFENLSTGDYTTSRWGFGDGLTSTLSNPAHIYQAVGAYTVSLAINGPGGTDEMIKWAYITVEGRWIYLPLVTRGPDTGVESAGLPQRVWITGSTIRSETRDWR